jgi:hypothetical protein
MDNEAVEAISGRPVTTLRTEFLTKRRLSMAAKQNGQSYNYNSYNYNYNSNLTILTSYNGVPILELRDDIWTLGEISPLIHPQGRTHSTV